MRQIYIDIDIAKNLHYASSIDSYGEILEEAFPFENHKEGFIILISKIQSFNKDDCIFGMESTAHYSNNLSNYLLINNFHVVIINPLQTFALRKTLMRDAKNDKIDSFIICQALTMHLGNEVTLEDTLVELKISVNHSKIL